MKIALVLSGQPRFLDEGYTSLKREFLDKHDVDVYSHIWWDNSYQGDVIKLHALDRYPNEDLGQKFLDLYRPKFAMIEPYLDASLMGVNDYDISSGEQSVMLHEYHKRLFSYALIVSQKLAYLSIKKSMEAALDSGIEYDLFVRARTDTTIGGSIALEELVAPDTLYTDFPNVDFAQNQVCDTIGIGDRAIARRYKHIYQQMDNISRKQVVFSTRYMEQTFDHIEQRHWDVRVIRDYKLPKHMDSYTDHQPLEDLPTWLVPNKRKFQSAATPSTAIPL